ncbi:MAG: DNA cytosine methyltransferase [Hyphomicrobium sp.]
MLGEGEAPCFIDAFAGCGGLSLGLLRSGWRGLFAIEKDAFAFATLSRNLIGLEGRYRFAWPEWLEAKPWTIESLVDEHRAELGRLRGKIDLLAGGPPCQGFSSAGRRRPADPRNQLVARYLEFVRLIEPRMVLIENVRGITYDFTAASSAGTERRNFAADIIENLKAHYHVFSDMLTCSAYGIPQSRPRFFIAAVRRSEAGELPPSFNPFAKLEAARLPFLEDRGLSARVSSYQAISDLECARTGTKPCPDSKGFKALQSPQPRSTFQKAMADGFDGPVSDTRLARHLPHIVERFERIIQECKKSGRLNVQLNREMRERYGIKKMAIRVLDPDKPAPTITSMPDDLLHYSEPRTLTVRENARLQTFPDWYIFQGKYTTGGDRRAREVPRFTQVANAVPPLLAELWGEVLLDIRDAVGKARKAVEAKNRKAVSDAKRHKRAGGRIPHSRRISVRPPVLGRRSERRRTKAI